MDKNKKIKEFDRITIAIVIGGTLGMMLLMSMIVCWQFCWPGAIIGGLVSAVIYEPRFFIGAISRAVRLVIAKISKFYNDNDIDWELVIVLMGMISAFISAFIGWTFLLDYYLTPVAPMEPVDWSASWLAYLLCTFLVSWAYMLAAVIIKFKYSTNEIGGIVGGAMILFYVCGGIITGLLFNPWLSNHTIPVLVAVLASIISFLWPVLFALGLAVIILLSALVVGIVVSLLVTINLICMDVCEWLYDLSVRIILLIITDNKLLCFFSATLGASLAYFAFGKPIFCVFGGIAGLCFAYILLFLQLIVSRNTAKSN